MQKTVTYGYGNADWGDLLTSYGGKTITYDAVGNPLSDGTWSYTWERGRRLKSMRNGSKTYSYVYNGSQLMAMTNRGNTIPCATGATSMTQRISSSTASEYRPFLS